MASGGDCTNGVRTGLAGRIANEIAAVSGTGDWPAGTQGTKQLNGLAQGIADHIVAGAGRVYGEVPTGPTTTTNTNDSYMTTGGLIASGSEVVFVGSPGNMTRVSRTIYSLVTVGGLTKVVFNLAYIPDSVNGEVVAIDYTLA